MRQKDESKNVPTWKKIWDRHEKRPIYLQAKDAVKIAKDLGISCNYVTILVWCRKTGIGYKIGGRWFVNFKKFVRFLEEEPVFYENTDDKNSIGN